MKEMSTDSALKKTDHVRIRDSNNGSYAGNQFSIDTGSLTSSNDMFALSEAHMEIPYTITMTGVALIGKAHFLMALKHGFYSKVAGIAVKLDNQALCTFTNLSNLYTHFNVLSTMNESDMATVGDLIGFHQDGISSYIHTTADNIRGVGECNSSTGSSLASDAVDSSGEYYQLAANKGFLKRAQQIGYHEADASLAPFVKAGRASETFKSNMTIAGTTITFNVCAIIRLSDIHDVFKTMPIMRNPNLNLSVQFHSCNGAITVDDTNKWQLAGLAMNPVNNFCSWQLKALDDNVITDATDCVITETMKNTSRSIVELVIPRIQMSDEAQMSYLNDMGSEHVVRYTDIHSNTETFASPAVSWQVNSALSGMTGFLMLVRLGSNGAVLTANNGAVLSTDHSPFTSAPNYLCSSQAISNLQVYLSNRPVFESPIQYNYDMYLDMMRAKSINGFSSNAGISSGLISRRDWEEGNHGYIYVKLPRSANIHADQSLQVRFTNDNIAKVTKLDLLGFIEVEKSYTIDVNTGKIKILY